ncbi:hypothetical protein [Salinibacter grassmerensis]|uniref:hypothetical protein n=1 Tax=Salinibacter grassmerensis TaxID=3040353 RepID=UPI0021E74065|nr:hypothetical protein [Salinibacter grassmerensis]
MAHRNKKSTWLDKRCKEYRENRKKWTYQHKHYDGQALIDEIADKSTRLGSKMESTLDSATVDFVVDEIKDNGEVEVSEVLKKKSITLGDDGMYGTYLPRVPREPLQNYVDRLKTSDYTNHFARVVNTYAGMMAAVADKNKRTWQEDDQDRGLKNHPARGDVASKLKKEADGKGTSWSEKFQDLLIQLLKFDKAYVLVEGLSEEGDDEAKIKFIDPRNVVNKKYEGGNLVELLVQDTRVIEPSLKSKRREQVEYIHYHREGFDRYRKQDDEVVRVTDDDGNPISGTYEFYDGAEQDESSKTIPVVEMELDINVGSELAVKANRIFQKQSERDHKQRMMNAQLLTLDVEDQGFEEARRTLTRGGRTVQGKGQFINPSAEPVESYSDTIKRKEADLYKSFFLNNQDSAVQKTATELRQDFRSGLEAILNVFKNELDRGEQKVLQLLEQVYFQNSPSLWGQATVSRTSDFEPTNKEAQAKKLRSIFFDVPSIELPPETKSRVVGRILELMNIEYEEEELLAEAREQQITRAQEQQASDQAPINIE